jgi:hypothetical protein
MLQGRDDLCRSRWVEMMATILEIANGAARNVCLFGEFLLGPVQETTGGTALFGRQ